MKSSSRALYFLLLSAVAICLLLIVAYLAYAEQGHVEESERLTVGGIFIAGCVLCISMTIYPSWLRQLRRSQIYPRAENGQDMPTMGYVAHHPDCGSFQSHRITVGAIEFCSGCLGLSIGSAISIVMMTVYLFLKPNVANGAAILAIAIGLSALLLTFLLSLQQRKVPFLNTAANACMIPGLCVVTIGMLEITGSLYAGLLSILFSFLWMDTRIRISQWRHSAICRLCPSSCKAY